MLTEENTQDRFSPLGNLYKFKRQVLPRCCHGIGKTSFCELIKYKIVQNQ